MKHSNIFKYVAGVAVLGFMTSCNDFFGPRTDVFRFTGKISER